MNLENVVSCSDLHRMICGLGIAEYMHGAVRGSEDEQHEARSMHSSSASRCGLSKCGAIVGFTKLQNAQILSHPGVFLIAIGTENVLESICASLTTRRLVGYGAESDKL